MPTSKQTPTRLYTPSKTSTSYPCQFAPTFARRTELTLQPSRSSQGYLRRQIHSTLEDPRKGSTHASQQPVRHTSLSNEPSLMCSPRNLIGQSQSGTGKTAAFTLNMLSRVDPSIMTPQVRQLSRPLQDELTTRQSASHHPENSLDRFKRSSIKLVNSPKSRVV